MAVRAHPGNLIPINALASATSPYRKRSASVGPSESCLYQPSHHQSRITDPKVAEKRPRPNRRSHRAKNNSIYLIPNNLTPPIRTRPKPISTTRYATFQPRTGSGFHEKAGRCQPRLRFLLLAPSNVRCRPTGGVLMPQPHPFPEGFSERDTRRVERY